MKFRKLCDEVDALSDNTTMIDAVRTEARAKCGASS